MVTPLEIIGWYNDGELGALSSALKKMNAASINELIQKHLQCCDDQDISLIRAVLLG